MPGRAEAEPQIDLRQGNIGEDTSCVFTSRTLLELLVS